MWVIVDKKSNRPYIPKKWDTEREASEELVKLLSPYPEGNEWRDRLEVRYRKKRIRVTGVFRGDGKDGRSLTKGERSKPHTSN